MKNFDIIKVILVAIFAPQFMMAQQTKESEKNKETYTIEDCVNHFEVDKAKQTKVGYQYWFADKNFTDEITLKMSIVNPHQSTHAPHRHIEEELFYILEGSAEFYLDGKKIIAGPQTSLYCPSNKEHGISNAGETILKYLVIKKDLK
ncbi:cupin domain-containing protein [Flavobacterium agrisoli]|uniref:Cupin domain-containing protein n=1 Tax=Flavobacterium agrisoli TaxID=2793066 RepID=A0A934UK20_9FLAO|nr:cupin domain-containing protein [Flavobacterium agrisoli]MBK0370124.1 cupin domain-containing protein [Flavobacterium agrisoli]